MKTKAATILCAALLAGVTIGSPAYGQGGSQRPHKFVPILTRAVHFDVSPAVRTIRKAPRGNPFSETVREISPEDGLDTPGLLLEDGPFGPATLFTGDPVHQRSMFRPSPLIESPLFTFEGLRNTNNPFLVAPPDPNGAIGPNNYVEVVNLVFAVYDRRGNLLTGPTLLGDLWQGFAIPDCTDLSGDPVVLYDKLDDRWLLSQFTTRGPNFYNCVAISQTADPTGPYFRYAFNAGPFFPDYPKYGVWSDSYILTSRDFGNAGGYGISVYALERAAMVAGNPNALSFHFFLDSAVVPISQIGDGLLPADLDGENAPSDGVPAPVIGSMDPNFTRYGAPFNALNVYELTTDWDVPTSSLQLVTQLPTAPFNSTFPCAPTSRQCIPQPGTTRKIDILSYRQRVTFRLAFRVGQYNTDTMVTNQSVQALPGIAGERWYEIHRTNGVYSIFQQGTFAPNDGVNRWMGSIAMDVFGNIALGYSVSNGTNVFPGIRYTGRLAGDPLGQMTLGEAVLQNGTGSQTGTSRWGDYTDMQVDPTDDCTFWYVNEYYQTTSIANWQTRIGKFQLPGCSQNYRIQRRYRMR